MKARVVSYDLLAEDGGLKVTADTQPPIKATATSQPRIRNLSEVEDWVPPFIGR
jgi:hypothetical protein